MKFAVVALLLQAFTAPDPAQMEKVPALGYTDVHTTCNSPPV